MNEEITTDYGIILEIMVNNRDQVGFLLTASLPLYRISLHSATY